MEFYALIKARYSVRSYDSQKEIEKEKLLRILDAGRMAPSAANRQPWKFLVIQTPKMLDKFRTLYPARWFAQANTIIVVKGNKTDAWVRTADGYNAIETDLTIAMDHIILAAANEGLATCWIAAFDPDKLKEVLELTDDEVVFAITPIGYAGEDLGATRPKTRKAMDEVVEWI